MVATLIFSDTGLIKSIISGDNNRIYFVSSDNNITSILDTNPGIAALDPSKSIGIPLLLNKSFIININPNNRNVSSIHLDGSKLSYCCVDDGLIDIYDFNQMAVTFTIMCNVYHNINSIDSIFRLIRNPRIVKSFRRVIYIADKSNNITSIDTGTNWTHCTDHTYYIEEIINTLNNVNINNNSQIRGPIADFIVDIDGSIYVIFKNSTDILCISNLGNSLINISNGKDIMLDRGTGLTSLCLLRHRILLVANPDTIWLVNIRRSFIRRIFSLDKLFIMDSVKPNRSKIYNKSEEKRVAVEEYHQRNLAIKSICTGTENRIYFSCHGMGIYRCQFNDGWSIRRLLWIAFQKNRDDQLCNIGKLPKELLVIIDDDLREYFLGDGLN